MSVFGQLASSLLIQGIKVASVATARLSGHEQPDDDEELPQKAEEPTPAQPVPCTTPFEQQNGAPDSPDVAVSIAGDDSLGSETTSDRSRLADVAKDVVLRIECYDNKRWSYGALVRAQSAGPVHLTDLEPGVSLPLLLHTSTDGGDRAGVG